MECDRSAQQASDLREVAAPPLVIDAIPNEMVQLKHVDTAKNTLIYISKMYHGLDTFISKKHFRPGGMAPSEWTRSVRAVRDTPVADYSVPGVKTTRRVTYRPPIAISPFLLALSVSYFKQTLWRCGQL